MDEQNNSEFIKAVKKYIRLQDKLDRLLVEKEIRKTFDNYSNSSNENINIIKLINASYENFGSLISSVDSPILDTIETLLNQKIQDTVNQFKYSDEVNELSQRYGIDNLKMQYIINNYGSMDNFLKSSCLDLDDTTINLLGNNLSIRDLDGKIDDYGKAKGYLCLQKAIFGNTNARAYSYGYCVSEHIENALRELMDREEQVIRQRFGLEDGIPRMLEEVGDKFNVTRERIRQIETKALRKLRFPNRIRPIREKLDSENIISNINGLFVPDNSELRKSKVEFWVARKQAELARNDREEMFIEIPDYDIETDSFITPETALKTALKGTTHDDISKAEDTERDTDTKEKDGEEFNGE